MIYAVGDTADELNILQKILEAGVLNSNEDCTLEITYKLSSGGILSVDSYNNIVQEEARGAE